MPGKSWAMIDSFLSKDPISLKDYSSDLFNSEFEEQLDKLNPYHSRRFDGSSVCFVTWLDSKIENRHRFYSILKSNMPEGTEIFGCRRDNGLGDSDYYAVLGFPYSLKSWKGLGKRLLLKRSDGSIDTIMIRVRVVVRPLEYCRRFLTEVHLFCEEGEKPETFGERLQYRDGRKFVVPLLDGAEEMWQSVSKDS